MEVIGVLDGMERHRSFRAVFYIFLLAAGSVVAIDPTRQLEKVDSFARFGWGGFLIVGSIMTLYGTLRDKWMIELQGMPLAASAVLGLIWVSIAGGGTTGRLAFAFFLCSLLTAMVSRFVGLWRLARAMKHMKSKQES